MPAKKNPPKHPVVVFLHGRKAPRGVDLDALSDFFDHFRSALRAYDRQRRGAAHTAGRGAPTDAAATAFRLVAFKTGSGIATIDPFVLSDLEAHGLDVSPDLDAPKSLVVLDELMQRVRTKEPLERPVIEALTKAQRSMGAGGRFGVKTPSMDRRVTVDRAVIDRLQNDLEVAGTTDHPVTIDGLLHFIETDEGKRAVGVRGPTGVDWVCSYGEDLRAAVAELVDQVVRVEGIGRQQSARQGRLTISNIAPAAEAAAQTLFALEDVPLAELMRRQGVGGAQGVDTFYDPSLDDDLGREFLDTMLGN